MPSNFSYVGYSSRLLTVQEVGSACNNKKIPTIIIGELNSCNYLMENTKYSDSLIGNYGYWFENVSLDYSAQAWHVSGYTRIVYRDPSSLNGDLGVRPAIEVPKSNIEY